MFLAIAAAALRAELAKPVTRGRAVVYVALAQLAHLAFSH